MVGDTTEKLGEFFFFGTFSRKNVELKRSRKRVICERKIFIFLQLISTTSFEA